MTNANIPLRLVVLVLAGLLYCNCDGQPPEILEHDLRLQYTLNPRTQQQYERLQVFVNVYDENGIDDLEWLFIIHDGAELFWRLNSNQWEQMEANDDIWIGAPAIGMASNAPFPSGEYRIVVYDASGREHEQSAQLSEAPDDFVPIFPTVTVQRAQNSNRIIGLALNSQYRRNVIRSYNVQGDLVGEYEGPDRLRTNRSAARFW